MGVNYNTPASIWITLALGVVAILIALIDFILGPAEE